MRRYRFLSVWMPLIVPLVLAALLAVTAPAVRKLGDRYQIALPVMALGCAAMTGQAPEYALRYGVLWAGIHGPKTALGDSPINMRPNGDEGGFPSGHTATAVFGASTLVNECVGNSLPAKAAALMAAGFTGTSRVHAGAHDIWQVTAGAFWGLICDRALRRNGAPRRAVRAALAWLGGLRRRMTPRLFQQRA